MYAAAAAQTAAAHASVAVSENVFVVQGALNRHVAKSGQQVQWTVPHYLEAACLQTQWWRRPRCTSSRPASSASSRPPPPPTTTTALLARPPTHWRAQADMHSMPQQQPVEITRHTYPHKVPPPPGPGLFKPEVGKGKVPLPAAFNATDQAGGNGPTKCLTSKQTLMMKGQHQQCWGSNYAQREARVRGQRCSGKACALLCPRQRERRATGVMRRITNAPQLYKKHACMHVCTTSPSGPTTTSTNQQATAGPLLQQQCWPQPR